jgi:ATP-binding cassette, subfamily F, member 3
MNRRYGTLRQEPQAREQDLRNYLGGFDFRGDMADAPDRPVLGRREVATGARADRAQAKPNLLLLDEPTNHLDLEMRHALTCALAEYAGSLVLVSHDRSLLRTVCDSLLLVADGRAQPFDGDIEDYLAWLTERREEPGTAALTPGQTTQRETRKAQRETAAAQRHERLARRRPLAREAQQLETRIAQLEAERKNLETRLADPDFYAQAAPAEVHKLSRRCTAVIAEDRRGRRALAAGPRRTR